MRWRRRSSHNSDSCTPSSVPTTARCSPEDILPILVVPVAKDERATASVGARLMSAPSSAQEIALRPQILVFTYHKTGTVLFEKVMRAVAAPLGLTVAVHFG